MKKKLAKSRAKGRGGWDDPTECSIEYLSRLLVGHVDKGDPIDVGNFAMMLFCRNENHTALKSSCAKFISGRQSAAPPQTAPAAPVLSDEEIDLRIDDVLRASGSSLRHFSIQKTKDDMRAAMRRALLAKVRP
jgi:hypothetical protein